MCVFWLVSWKFGLMFYISMPETGFYSASISIIFHLNEYSFIFTTATISDMKTTNFSIDYKIVFWIIWILLAVASQSDANNGQNWNDGGDGIKWQMNCDFPGHEIKRISSTGEQCGSLCITSPQCTHFNHADRFCHLKNASLSTNRTFVQVGMCGFIPRRLESGKDHWNTEADGIKWFVNCDFFGHDFDRKPSTGEMCGGICLANLKCSHFRHVDGFCHVKNAPLSISRTTVNGGVCGYIPSREFDEKDNEEMTSNFEEICESYIDTTLSSSAVQPNGFLKLEHSFCLLAVYLLSYNCFQFIGYL